MCRYVKITRRDEAAGAFLSLRTRGVRCGAPRPRLPQALSRPAEHGDTLGLGPGGSGWCIWYLCLGQLCVYLRYRVSWVNSALRTPARRAAPGSLATPGAAWRGSLPVAPRGAGSRAGASPLGCRPGAPVLVFTPLLQPARWFVPSAKYLTGGGVGKRDEA